MRKLTALSAMLILLLVFSNPNEISAQIHDIKKKSSSNKSKRTSSSSSKSSSKKKSKSHSSSSSSSGSDVSVSDVFGCLGNLFDAAGCLFSALENTESSSSNYTSNDYEYDDDYSYYESEEHSVNNNIVEEPIEKTTTNTENTSPDLRNSNNEDVTPLPEEFEVPSNVLKTNTEEIPLNSTTESKSEVTLDIRANFDVSMHKGIDKNYLHVDYLPGIRASFDFFMFDFRFDILTEYTDDFPDSFKSWELLALFNLTANQDYSVILGTGVQNEEYEGGSTFHEYYLGAKIPLKNKKDFVDIDTRFSKDYKTDVFPFFEFGGRYNVRFLNEKKVSGYITLGATYQNYYQAYDIWGIRGGVILNIH